MKTGTITINENGVEINAVNNTVWLTQHQIAALFGYGVFVSTINNNIRSILKAGVLREADVCKTIPTGNNSTVEVYNLEMIAALAFHVRSKNTEIFRDWFIQQATKKETYTVLTVLTKSAMLN